jgi:short-subunit dehydrogenase
MTISSSSNGRPFALVTGASSGIGLELARQFVRNGFDLMIAAENDGVRSAAGELGQEEGAAADVEGVQVDLAMPEGVDELYRRARATGRPLDAVAINAGVGVGGDFARETSLESELNLIRLNVLSTVHLAKLVLGPMVARGQGRVLFTSSIAAIMPTPMEAVYGASKAFVLEFAASLRHELKDTGVSITALMPGPTNTNFFVRAGLDDKKVAEKAEENDPADVARMGFEALMAGKERIVAGNLSVKAQAAAARFTPESVKAAQHEKLARQPRTK